MPPKPLTLPHSPRPTIPIKSLGPDLSLLFWSAVPVTGFADEAFNQGGIYINAINAPRYGRPFEEKSCSAVFN